VTVEIGSNATYPVETLHGQQIELRDPAEATFYLEAQSKYLSENSFTASSDKRALDRLIFLETLMHRYQRWLAMGMDYDGILSGAQEETIRKAIRETVPMISQIQTDLGLTKAQREKDQHESVSAYLNDLKVRAKEHGVRRERQLTAALDLMNRLFTLVGAYGRSSESERKKLDLESAEDIVEWINDTMRPEYDAIDEYFRTHQQKFWIGSL
jgi:hypothetical protein